MVGVAKDAVKELIKEGFVLQKPTSYGLQVSLNPARIDEITKIIESWQAADALCRVYLLFQSCAIFFLQRLVT